MYLEKNNNLPLEKPCDLRKRPWTACLTRTEGFFPFFHLFQIFPFWISFFLTLFWASGAVKTRKRDRNRNETRRDDMRLQWPETKQTMCILMIGRLTPASTGHLFSYAFLCIFLESLNVDMGTFIFLMNRAKNLFIYSSWRHFFSINCQHAFLLNTFAI